MRIDTLLKQDCLIVRIDGELDMHSAHEFRQTVDQALNKSGTNNILLNFNHVTFIDSSGLGVILGRYKRISQLGGQIVAVRIQPQVSKIFELSGLFKIIKQYNSETEALECL